MSSDTLEARDVCVYFDGVRAVDGVNLTLTRGEIKGLIGPNGAGKTTFLHAISGIVRPTAGCVTVCGVEITGWPPERVGRRGVARTFQDIRIFRGLSVFENVEVAATGGKLSRKAARATAWNLLEMLGVSHLAAKTADSLAVGDVRRVGIARAAATSPDFLLLDEPAAGLNDRESAQLVETLPDLQRNLNCGILLVDHDMRVIMGACERIQVLDSGKTISEGTRAEVQRDPAVIAAYLGS
jgi:branched-chain amino acid transport system ATP-binding protein